MTDGGVTSAENRCKGPRLVSQSFTLSSHSSNAIDESLILSYPSPRHRILHSDGAASPLAGEQGRLPVGRGELGG